MEPYLKRELCYTKNVIVPAGSVFHATCNNHNERNFPPSNAKSGTAKIASLVQSVSSRFAKLQTPTNKTMPQVSRRQLDEQVTGEGGLALEPLNFWSAFVDLQTDPAQWKTTACHCAEVASSIMSDVTLEGRYGPNCDNDQKYDDNDDYDDDDWYKPLHWELHWNHAIHMTWEVCLSVCRSS